jgi:hypothetical protein
MTVKRVRELGHRRDPAAGTGFNVSSGAPAAMGRVNHCTGGNRVSIDPAREEGLP